MIVFSEPKGDRSGGTYAVYFGNPAAPAVEQTPPQMGLMLKTLEMPQGMSGAAWAGVEESLSHARVCGVDFWKQVFDAFNPFGPQSRYISVYDGFLECPKPGIYKFATMSDDGSFLLVDGELVAEWPGQGHNIDAGRHGEKNGQKNLTAGRHAFRYVGLAFDGGQADGRRVDAAGKFHDGKSSRPPRFRRCSPCRCWRPRIPPGRSAPRSAWRSSSTSSAATPAWSPCSSPRRAARRPAR